MKLPNFLLALVVALGLTSNAFATTSTGKGAWPLPDGVRLRLNNSATAGPQVGLGWQVTNKKIQVMKAVYDFAKLGGASGTTYVLKDAAGGEAVLPVGAVIFDGMTDEVTDVTGTATISLGVNSTTDILGATAVATWSGVQAITPTGAAAGAIKVVTTPKAVQATLGSGSITAGKINVFLFYLLSD